MASGAGRFDDGNDLETCWTFSLILVLFTGRTAARASRWENSRRRAEANKCRTRHTPLKVERYAIRNLLLRESEV